MSMTFSRYVCLAVSVTTLLLGAALVQADTVMIPASRDNTLIEDLDGAVSNGSGPSFFAGKISQGTRRRAVCLFDVAAHIPPGSLVTGVELRLHVTGAGSAGDPEVTLHRLLADWGEGASAASGGSGATAAPGDATWIHTFHPDGFWITPGGDFDPAVSASAVIGESGLFNWSSSTMAADVQSWLESPETNFGWLLMGNESQASTVRQFASRENSDESIRPALAVEYTPGATQVQAETWGRVKSRYRNTRSRQF